jgi:hypothetical protein
VNVRLAGDRVRKPVSQVQSLSRLHIRSKFELSPDFRTRMHGYYRVTPRRGQKTPGSIEKQVREKTSLATIMFTNYASVNMPLSHKHLKLDQAKIDKARRLLGLATEQETLDRALDLIIAEEPILRAHRKVRGSGGVVDIFGHQ